MEEKKKRKIEKKTRTMWKRKRRIRDIAENKEKYVEEKTMREREMIKKTGKRTDRVENEEKDV